MPRNSVGVAIPLSTYNEEFVVASFNLFISNLELIENIISVESSYVVQKNPLFCLT